ncbi:MAG: Ig-like domain-containing protein, partial [archaeon]
MMKEKKAAAIVVLIALFLVSLQANYGTESLLDQSALSLEKTAYSLGDKAGIYIAEDYIDSSYLTISTDNNIYKYLGTLSNPTVFNIKEETLHTVKLLTREDNQLIDQEAFDVGEIDLVDVPEEIEEEVEEEIPEEEIIATGIVLELDKANYDVNEPVWMTIAGTESFDESQLRLTITSDTQSYRYLGISSEILFIPRMPGAYQISLKDDEDKLLAQQYFDVLGVEAKAKGKVFTNVGITVPKGSIKIYNSKKELAMTELELETDEDITDATLRFQDKPVNEIKFRNINTRDNPLIGFEELPKEKYNIKDEKGILKPVIKAYAIDPTQLNFTNATVTATAKGTELWKCKEWDFENQTCLGTWEKLMNLVPGQEYSFLLTKDDPGLAEVGDSRPTAFTDATNVGTNEANAYDGDDSSYATIDIDANANPTYVTYTTFNISAFNNASTINWFNITFTVATSGTFTDDTWYLEYSTNGGSGWTECYSSSSAQGTKINISCNPSFSSWTLQDFANNFQVRTGGEKNGAPDRVDLFVYELFATINYTAPNKIPTPLSWAKNASSVYMNNSVMFNATWVDSDGTLDAWKFSWNLTGTWSNATVRDFTANNVSNTTLDVDAAVGSVIHWKFYANDTDGEWNVTPVQTFTVLGIDTTPPTVDNESVTPTTGVSGTLFNISADVSDDQTIQTVRADIRMPEGTINNYTMSPGSGNSYYVLYISQSGGNFSFIVNASDGTNTNASDSWTFFNVTANITTPIRYYQRGDTVVVAGVGFYADGTVTVDVDNSTGDSVSGFPDSATADENGTISFNWEIPSDADFGNFTITATDDTLGWLTSTTDIYLVVKPSSATTHTDNGVFESLSKINDSDDVYTNVEGNNVEVYLEANFSSVLPAGYDVTTAVLYFEHREISTDDMYIKWRNSTSGGYDTICTITNLVAEGFSSCDLSSYVTNSASLNSLSVRLSDNNGANNGENWTLIDFVYLDIDYSLSSEIAITINEPVLDSITYNPDSTNDEAYDGGDTANPGPSGSILQGTEASSAEYTNLSSSDNARWHTLVAVGSQRAYQSYKFIVSDSIGDISSLTVRHEGFATETTTPDPDSYHIYIWNYTAGAYQEIATPSASGSDQLTTVTLAGNGTDFINSGGSGEVWILVEGDFRTGGSGNQQADLWTDYMELKVNKGATISGLQDINATVTDADGVAACDYYYTYSNGTLAGSITGMTDQGSNIWLNTSDTTDYADGFYYIYVNCTDGGSSQANASIYVRVANQAPVIYLRAPENHANLSYSNVNFTWNATESGSGVLTCNLSIDGIVEHTNVPSPNGQNVTRNVSLSDGTHYWNVTCRDSGSQSNSSTTWDLTIDTISPTVNLNSPLQDNTTNSTSITFIYTPTDMSNFTNCSLIINGVINQTNTTTYNNTQNNFTLTDIPEGEYLWSVNCTDTFGNVGNSSSRNLTIDRTPPSITLYYPDNDAFGSGTVNFNFTVTDNFDSNLTCNLSIDGTVSTTNNNFAALNNSVTNLTETGIEDGNHTWSITCWDNIPLSNTSSTFNFTISAPPTVNLLSPPDNNWTNASFINFTFYVSDGEGIFNCTFIFNGQVNQTKNWTLITNPGNNTFNLSNIPEGRHNWTINCTDNTSQSTQPTEFDLYIDWTGPSIQLHKPDDDDSFPTSTVNFNFTVTDNLDSVLVCNLSIDGTVSTTNNNFNANNGSITNLTEIGLIDGDHWWNITCWDNASNTNTSETRNFSVDGPPVLNLVSPPPNAKSQENVTFIFYAGDSSGLSNCSLIFNGDVNQTKNATQLTNYSNNNFTLNSIPEGVYNWTVNCTDTGGQSNQPKIWNLTIDMTAPTVQAHDPNGTTFSTNSIEFNFTVTDGVSLTMICNVTVDNGNYSSTVNASNASLESVTIAGISDGFHYWNVSCYDQANNTAWSNTLNFTIDAAPQVYLDKPDDGYGDTDGNVVFTAEIWDDNLTNCSLIINGVINQTKNLSELPNVNTGSTDNFTLSNMPQGVYNWTVNCTDINGYVGTDTTRTLYVDWTYPWILLHEPENNTNESYTTISFNFTAYDNVDPILECNLTVKGEVNTSQLVNATANVPTIVNISGFLTGNYTWNVTCNDSSELQNKSETWIFEVISDPTVELNSPPNGSTDSDGDVTFKYIPRDVEGLSYCDIYIDGEYNDTETVAGGGVHNNQLSNFTITGISEGNHSWYVNCTDTDTNYGLSDTWIFYVDLTNPWITLHYPSGDIINTSSVTFNWTAYDNFDSNLTCNLTINSTIYPNLGSLNATTRNYTISNLNDSRHFWNVTCWDNAGRQNTSATYNFTIAVKPEVGLNNPANNNRNDSVNIYVYYTPTDNSNAIRNCTLILNGDFNITNSSVSEGEQNHFYLPSLANGSYTWDVNCTDYNDNWAINGTTKTFYVDIRPPTIVQRNPTQAQTFDDDNIFFNWTASDHPGTTITCNLTVSDPIGARNDTVSATSGAEFNTTLANLSVGIHYWNLTCWDDLGNVNTTVTWNFTINEPDLYINNSEIFFSDDNPDLNTNITIFANVTNIGGSNAVNVLVDFWDGLPGVGTYIGNDTRNVAVDDTVTFNVTWNISAGYYYIWVVIDSDDSISEQNESNNNATINISVLWSNITEPPSNTWTNTALNDINITLGDYTNGTINYTFFVDGSINGENGTVEDRNSTVISITFSSEGNHTVIVQAEDDLGRRKNSTGIYIIYDATDPSPNFETLNATFFNDTTPGISFNISDNFDDVLNYTLFVDGIEDNNGSVNNWTTENVDLSVLGEGRYNITLQAEDEAGNRANSSIIIFIDQTPPTINLTYPENHANLTITTVSLNFSVWDNLDPVLTCNLTLDGAVNRSNFNVDNNTEVNTTVENLDEGQHNWNVTCWDGRDQNNIVNRNYSADWDFNIFIAPSITGLIPPHKNWTNNENVIFYFNVSDDTGLTNCSILLDGVINQTKNYTLLTNGGQNNFSVTNMNGTYTWSIICFDNTTQNVNTTTSERTLYVDLYPPEPSINTASFTWFNTSSPSISFIITDNMDWILNYTFFVNGSASTTGAVANNTPFSDSLSGLSNGTYIIKLEAYDNASNKKNSSAILIYVDTIVPTINLSAPGHDT